MQHYCTVLYPNLKSIKRLTIRGYRYVQCVVCSGRRARRAALAEPDASSEALFYHFLSRIRVLLQFSKVVRLNRDFWTQHGRQEADGLAQASGSHLQEQQGNSIKTLICSLQRMLTITRSPSVEFPLATSHHPAAQASQRSVSPKHSQR
jgi:hypothetical protein